MQREENIRRRPDRSRPTHGGRVPKWRDLSHHGPLFPPPYQPLPRSVKLRYNGRPVPLSQPSEEVAGFFARLSDHPDMNRPRFRANFFQDWRKVMTRKEREMISDLDKCDFSVISEYYVEEAERRRSMSKEEKKELKLSREELREKFGYCWVDGHRQRVGNYRVEPPGLFRGRGDHPHAGRLKRRVQPEDVVINLGEKTPVPPAPAGHRWGEIRHDRSVTWLASWTDNILGKTKYVQLNPDSTLRSERDRRKYETARQLGQYVARIRRQYQRGWKADNLQERQKAVALFFIDKLALRAGNEKDPDFTADSVGCCSLRVEHVSLSPPRLVQLDFPGKDGVRYRKDVMMPRQVFLNLAMFCAGKHPGQRLFDKLSTTLLNRHLQGQMRGLTAKVFRTYNASTTLEKELGHLKTSNMSLPEKLLAYNRANRAVAIMCNHQRSIPKTFAKQMESLQLKVNAKKDAINQIKEELKKLNKSCDVYGKKKKRLNQLEMQHLKLRLQAADREENKQIALGTSKLNYLDPRISVAWCRRLGVPIEKIYSKTQRERFQWAINETSEQFRF